MQLKKQLIRTQAVIKPAKDGGFEVHIGVTIPKRGTLLGCQTWCHDNGVPIRNQEEVNRIKYGNMPIQEMM